MRRLANARAAAVTAMNAWRSTARVTALTPVLHWQLHRDGGVQPTWLLRFYVLRGCSFEVHGSPASRLPRLERLSVTGSHFPRRLACGHCALGSAGDRLGEDIRPFRPGGNSTNPESPSSRPELTEECAKHPPPPCAACTSARPLVPIHAPP